MATTNTVLVETGSKQGADGRRYTAAEQRRALVGTYRGSGLTKAAFARREGIRYSTFCSWMRAEEPEREPEPPVRFTEVTLPVPAKSPCLEVRLPDGTQLRGSDAAELAKLVRALRS